MPQWAGCVCVLGFCLVEACPSLGDLRAGGPCKTMALDRCHREARLGASPSGRSLLRVPSPGGLGCASLLTERAGAASGKR